MKVGVWVDFYRLFLFFSLQSLGGNIVSAFPNSDLNPVLAAGSSKVSVISNGPYTHLQEDSLKAGSSSSDDGCV